MTLVLVNKSIKFKLKKKKLVSFLGGSNPAEPAGPDPTSLVRLLVHTSNPAADRSTREVYVHGGRGLIIIQSEQS